MWFWIGSLIVALAVGSICGSSQLSTLSNPFQRSKRNHIRDSTEHVYVYADGRRSDLVRVASNEADRSTVPTF